MPNVAGFCGQEHHPGIKLLSAVRQHPFRYSASVARSFQFIQHLAHVELRPGGARALP